MPGFLALIAEFQDRICRLWRLRGAPTIKAAGNLLRSLQRALFWYNYLDQLEPELRWMHWDAAFYFLQVFLGTEE